MNRSLFVFTVLCQLLTLSSLTAAQSESSLSEAVSSLCAKTSQGATIKKRPRSANNESSAADVTAAKDSSVVVEASKPLRVEFSGLNAVKSRDALITLCDEGAFSPGRVPNTEMVERILKEMLISVGYAHARVHTFFEQQSILRVFVEEGPRLSLAEIRFEGNKVFPDHELLATVHGCLKRFGERTVTAYDTNILDYCNRLLENRIRASGYLQAKVVRSRLVKKSGYLVSYSIDEGTLYRVGRITIKGQTALTEQEIRSRLTLREGDIADGNKIARWLFEDMKDVYGDMGFIQYMSEPIPTFKQVQGIVDFDVVIEEGKRFSLRSITFVGDLLPGINLEDLLMVRAGDFYNQRLFRESISRLNDLALFEPIDADGDVDWRTNEENAELTLVIKLKKRS